MSAELVTANVGAGFGGASRREGMLGWATDAVERTPLVVCAQEVPLEDTWLDV